ncbi:uncharacterized protein CDAR_540671 [Caerostris darwini]|uniref:Uncharacterized protein n=1 Tax=Caerostris darwini TaxID=1538125 RepID=A0AAV4VLJ7_9ARAC|nr:uncharacterized protein CDAR_540671 [Caerostris darwini]
MTVPSKSPSNKRWWTLGKQIARIVVVVLCLGGFLFQTTEFLMLYWTYPTVVDIQKSSPSYLEIPAITICNPVGYNYTAMCTEFGVGVCMIEELVRFNLVAMCNQHPDSCLEGNIAPDYIAITYIKFLRDLPYLSYNMHDKLRETLEHYMNCTITYAGQEKPCKLHQKQDDRLSRKSMFVSCVVCKSKHKEAISLVADVKLLCKQDVIKNIRNKTKQEINVCIKS